MSLKYVHEEPDRHGNIRVYFRKRGSPRIRLREKPGTEAFYAEYKAALDGRALMRPKQSAAVEPNTFGWLCAQYLASPDFGRLDIATQTMRRRHLDFLRPQFGPGPLAQIMPRHVRAMRDNKDKPHAANNVLKTLRAVFKWAVKADYMDANPAREVEKIPTSGDGHHTWTVEEVAQFLKRHPWHTRAGLALALLLFFGVRRSDVVKLGRQMESVDGSSLRLTETKGRARVTKTHDLPILPPLRAVLMLHPGETTYLLTSYGRPFKSGNAFGNWFKDRCREADLPHCTAHGLRKAGATVAAENDATVPQLMALYGWKTPAQAIEYIRKANQKKMARQAAEAQNLGVCVALSPGDGTVREIAGDSADKSVAKSGV